MELLPVFRLILNYRKGEEQAGKNKVWIGEYLIVGG